MSDVKSKARERAVNLLKRAEEQSGCSVEEQRTSAWAAARLIAKHGLLDAAAPGAEPNALVDAYQRQAEALARLVDQLRGNDGVAELRREVAYLRAKSVQDEAAHRRRVEELYAALRPIAEVAAELRNTPSVCKKYYIHPLIGELYEDGKLHAHWQATMAPIRGLSKDESILLHLLKNAKQKLDHSIPHLPKARS